MVKQNLVTKTILEEGIPYNFKGYGYIFEAVNLVLSDPDILNALTKELYPNIAVKSNSTPMAVERAIRNSIKKAWHNKDGKKPTNSEFLTLLSYKIISKYSLSS